MGKGREKETERKLTAGARGILTGRPGAGPGKTEWWLPLVAAVVFSGCADMPVMEVDDFVDPHRPIFREAHLTPAKLARRMEECDQQYAEPRTPKKVELSLETAELSISKVNDYEALWRAARACYWLATRVPELERREKYAMKGYRLAKEAQKTLSIRPEPYYYTALNIGAYCAVKHELGQIPAPRLLKEARDAAEMASALNEKYDYAGPHRFLGKLMVDSSRSLTHSVGSFEKGLEHLRRAAELAPEFAQNQLFLAQAYVIDDNYDAARAAIEEVIRSTVPPDHSVEHSEWMREATSLLADLPASDSDLPSADVSGFEEPLDRRGPGK